MFTSLLLIGFFLAVGVFFRKGKASPILLKPASPWLLLTCLFIGSMIAVSFIVQDVSESSDRYTSPFLLPARYRQEIPLGSPAPDFTLARIENGQPVHLADMIGKRPLVLVFGNFGCPYFCTRLDAVSQLQMWYQDRVDFLFVYIDNQHPEPDALQSFTADPQLPPSARENRVARIRAGLKQFEMNIPCVLDSADNQTQEDYLAYPARLVIIDRNGQIGFDSGNVLHSGLNPEGAAQWIEDNTPYPAAIPGKDSPTSSN